MKIRKIQFLYLIFTLFLLIFVKKEAYAYNVVPASSDYYYKTIFYSPVYSDGDINSTLVFSLDAHTSLNVNGMTDSGFYRVVINNTNYYIPGLYVEAILKYPTGTEAIKEKYNKIAESYNMLLESSEATIQNFMIKDITGDGTPELINANGREIYTSYDGRPVMIFYSETSYSFYYNKDKNLLASGTYVDSKPSYILNGMNYNVLPWGQVVSIAPNLLNNSISDFKQINTTYENIPANRLNLGSTLYSLYVAGSL